MSDDLKNIEDLFKQAADNSVGAPPPPPDWPTMSSMLKESALIKTGAGAAKVGVGKMIAAKVLTKATVAVVTVGAVVTGTALVITKPWEDNEGAEMSVVVDAESRQDKQLEQAAVSDEFGTLSIENDLREVPSLGMSTEGVTDAQGLESESEGFVGEVESDTKKRDKEGGETADLAWGSKLSNSGIRDNVADNANEAATDAPEQSVQDAVVQSGAAKLPKGLQTQEVDVALVENKQNENVKEDANNDFLQDSQNAGDQESNDLASNAVKSTINNNPKNDLAIGDDSMLSVMNDEVSSATMLNSGVPIHVFNAAKRSSLKIMDILIFSGLEGAAESKIINQSNSLPEFIPQPEPWFIFSPIVSFDNSRYNIDQLELNDLNNSNFDLELEDNAIHHTFGLRVGIKLMPFAWLETGIVYSKRSAISGTVLLKDATGANLGLAEYQLSGKYYEIPVNIVLRDNTGNLGYFGKVGMHFASNLPNSGSEFRYFNFDTEIMSTIAPSAQTIVPAVNFGGGLEYSFAPKWSAFAEGTYRYALKPILNAPEFKDAPINPKWSTLSIGLGINYYFIKDDK